MRWDILQIIQCVTCGNNISANKTLLKELTIHLNTLSTDASKLTQRINAFPPDSNDPDIVTLRTMRTKRKEKIVYINNIIKNLQHQIRMVETTTYHSVFINNLIQELTKSGYSNEYIKHLRKISNDTHMIKVKRAQKEIHGIHRKADIILSRNEWRNSAGYFDPTCKLAVDSVTKR